MALRRDTLTRYRDKDSPALFNLLLDRRARLTPFSLGTESAMDSDQSSKKSGIGEQVVGVLLTLGVHGAGHA